MEKEIGLDFNELIINAVTGPVIAAESVDSPGRFRNALKKITFAGAAVLGSIGITTFNQSPASANSTPAEAPVATPLPDDIPLAFVWSDGEVETNQADYGYTPLSSDRSTVGIASANSAAAPHAYDTVKSDGEVTAFGTANYFRDASWFNLNKPVVGMAVTPDGGGYWEVAADGGVFSFGDAGFYGSAGDVALNKPVVGMEATADGDGYWLVAADGGVFSFGDAGFYGSAGDEKLNEPIVGMAPTSDDKGYWLAGKDGGVFAYGDAGFYGSVPQETQINDVVGIVELNTKDSGYGLIDRTGFLYYYLSNGNNGLGSPNGLRPDATVVGATGFVK